MTISMYDASIPVFIRMLTNCDRILDKAVLRKYSRPFNFVGPSDESCPRRAPGVPKAESCNGAIAHRRDASPQGIFL
jgi:hypothetical protein